MSDIAREPVLERLHAAAYLVSGVLGYDCLVVNADSRVTLELPPNHLSGCFCKRLEPITGRKNSIDHFFTRCEKATESDSYIIYNCPFGLANIIIPAFKNSQLIAALQIGPILTGDADALLMKYGLPDMGAGVERLQSLKNYLDALPQGNLTSLIAVAKLVNALVTDESLVFRSSQATLEAERAEGDLGSCPDIVFAVQEFISSHFTDNEISLNAVAENVYVHPSYLSRIFSKNFNCHFRSYINTLRVNLAAELLTTTDESVGEICREVGFSDHNYFNKQFKQLKGMSPSEYRNKTMNLTV